MTVSTFDTLKLIVAAWREAGMRAPVAASATSGDLCGISDCPAMPFVELKLPDALSRLCFRHFQAAQRQVEAARAW